MSHYDPRTLNQRTITDDAQSFELESEESTWGADDGDELEWLRAEPTHG